jgi:four helix bundle protein
MRNEDLIGGAYMEYGTDNKNTVQVKSLAFGKRIVKLHKYLLEKKKEVVMSKQILRSGTSIGANIREAEYAISKKEFYYKMYITLKECGETQYWLELLYTGAYIEKELYPSIKADCDELMRMLTAITKTVKSRKLFGENHV